MRNGLWIVMCLLVFGGTVGCSSDTLPVWIDRANAQLAMQQNTTDGLYASKFKEEEANQDRSVDSAFADTVDAFVNKATTQPTSQPSDQRAWLKEQQGLLKVQLKASREKEATLRARQSVSDAGFDDIRASLQHVKDINSAWYRSNADTAAQIQALTAQVQQLILTTQQQKNK
jgi:hypothetical protein